MITAPIITGISSKAIEVSGLNKKNTEHHQLTNSYTKLQHDMVTKFDAVFQSVKLDFDNESDTNMRNCITNKVFAGDGVSNAVFLWTLPLINPFK